MKKYIFEVFAAEHYINDNNYILGFGFKNDKDFFDRQNFQLKIKKNSSLKEFSNQLLKLSLIIKEAIEK